MTSLCSNNIKESLSQKHGLISRTYSEKSLIVEMISGSSNLANGKKRKRIWNKNQHIVYQLPSEPSRQEEFKDLLSFEVVGKLREEIRIEQTKTKKIKKITSLQSTPQVLSSFKEYTPSVTYREEVEETLGTPIEVEPLDETQLEDLGLNTYNDDIPHSYREVPSFYEPKP
ncbi:hypothetical protein Tco_1278172 [Tanacetum coccineum]